MGYLSQGQDELLAASVPADSAVAVVSGQSFAVCRALHVGTAGTATLICASGATATNFPLKEGVNPIRCTRVTFGTASDVWALY